MAFEDILKRHFDRVYKEVDFVRRTYNSLKGYGFNDENSIACVSVCRDEISQSLRSIIKHMWGEAFNLSSLAGMSFAGKTGLKAAMHHAPSVDGKERYVFYAMPHIAMDEEGSMGMCRREGRQEESVACGALDALRMELEAGKLNLSMDNEDIEQSLTRMRLLREIPYGHKPDLLELTRITQKVIQADLENTLKAVVDTKKSDYAIVSGIQIHGPVSNFIWPKACYVVLEGVKKDIEF